jgi:hypothetical protein
MRRLPSVDITPRVARDHQATLIKLNKVPQSSNRRYHEPMSHICPSLIQPQNLEMEASQIQPVALIKKMAMATNF